MVVVLVVLALGVGMSYLTNRRTTEPVITEVDQITKGWKIYKNSEWGFTINYPDNWVLKIDEYEVSSNKKRAYFSLISQETINLAVPDKAPLCRICIETWNYTDEAWSNFKNSKPAQINGISGYEGISPGIEESYVTAIEYDGFTYVVGSYFQELNETEKLIKDSFKFLKRK